MTAVHLGRHWDELVTTALLGTDRRDPPAPAEGPVADLVADAVRPDPSGRLVADVAATVVALRAGLLPGPPADRLAPPVDDQRPVCPPHVARSWRYLVEHWPVLEDEWVLHLVQQGWRLAPDVAVELLLRHRADPVRRARVEVAVGPLAGWLADHVPQLAARGAASAGRRAADGAVTTLPELAVPAEWHPLLTAEAGTVAAELVPVFSAGRFGPAHRAVLVHLVARVRRTVLADLAASLAAVDPRSPSAGLALSLSDLARTRARVLRELDRPTDGP